MAKVNRVSLLDALKKVTKVISNITTQPVLKGTLVEIANNQMKLTGTNLKTSIITKIDCDTGMFSESFVADAKLFLDIISKISSQEIEISFSDGNINIKGGDSNFNIRSIGDKNLFPNVEQSISDNKEIVIKSDVLRELTFKTIPFTSEDETRPTLGGVKLEFDENKMIGTSLDGYRLGHYVAQVENEKKAELLIESDALSNIIKTLDKDTVTIIYNDNSSLVGFNLGETLIFTQQLAGTFFDYRNMLKPDNYKARVIVNAQELRDAIERVSIVAREKGTFNPTTISINDNTLVLVAKNEIGNVMEKVSVDTKEGETMDYKISFNPNYLLAGIKATTSDKLEIRFNGELNPGYIIEEENNFVYLILPIRTKE
ncbi:DNA polymerase III subunit beta [Tissierella carlieri]|uniref:Beta sliding clamp n=1 Tax=Tissierella carlieri TaxID=689904 RepID=A0ABT1SEJ4_9FIRM|nr:DNA polymerase III subunit beta [Tissierella carlieri]MCQ4924912.1 DNA polymerase III subunit beta [Tissierella carlieri]